MEGERPGRRRNIDGARSKLQPPVLSDDGRLDPTIRAVTPLRPDTNNPLPCWRRRTCRLHSHSANETPRWDTSGHTQAAPPLSEDKANRLPPQRNLPARGFRPATLLGAAGAIMIYGWYKLTLGIREQK